ncbi:MAG: hypothetical protein KDD70_12765, partial [Bdellovibrionales bacterium]|nr:hypothetical protein [Bdellovibrionales bacterium]
MKSVGYTVPSIQDIPPLPFFELRSLVELVEQGFLFDVARTLVAEIFSHGARESSCLRIAPHPKGWTILSHTEVIPGSFFDEKSDAIERARSDAQFSE